MRTRSRFKSFSVNQLLGFYPLLAVSISIASGCAWRGDMSASSDSASRKTPASVVAKKLSPTEAAVLVRPSRERRLRVQNAGLFGHVKQTEDKLAYSDEEKNRLLEVFNNTNSVEVKTALLPGFARQKNYTAMPLIIDSVNSDSPVLSGRAIATAEHLLGVRYNVQVNELANKRVRKEVGEMIDKDWRHLQQYPRFQDNID